MQRRPPSLQARCSRRRRRPAPHLLRSHHRPRCRPLPTPPTPPRHRRQHRKTVMVEPCHTGADAAFPSPARRFATSPPSPIPSPSSALAAAHHLSPPPLATPPPRPPPVSRRQKSTGALRQKLSYIITSPYTNSEHQVRLELATDALHRPPLRIQRLRDVVDLARDQLGELAVGHDLLRDVGGRVVRRHEGRRHALL
jgi:hypothetical protein